MTEINSNTTSQNEEVVLWVNLQVEPPGVQLTLTNLLYQFQKIFILTTFKQQIKNSMQLYHHKYFNVNRETIFVSHLLKRSSRQTEKGNPTVTVACERSHRTEPRQLVLGKPSCALTRNI